MKIEVSNIRDKKLKELYPGQFDMFSHFEFISAIPQVLFAVTSVKENGKPNINFHSWSSFFSGDNQEFFIVTPISKDTHTFKNIERTGEFCINFLSLKYYDDLLDTVANNSLDDDEFIAGGFNIEEAKTVSSPRIKESFMTLECKKHNMYDIDKNVIMVLVVGRVLHMAVEEEYIKGYDKKYGREGYMFNIHNPLNLDNVRSEEAGVATVKIEKTFK